MALISKSKYMKGVQCPRLVWYVFNKPEAIPDPDEAQQARFDQGHEVGEYAKELFPEGVDIPWGDFNGTLRKTKEVISENNTVFEASFKHEDLYCRVDILRPTEDGWNIIEVKSSTRVKDVHIQDVAFQKYCLENYGLDVNDCYLMHINNQYVRDGEVEPDKLFEIEEISEEVDDEYPNVQNNLNQMRRMIKQSEPPEVPVGPQGNEPYECPLEEECCSTLPDHNVTELFYIGKDAYELTNEGVFRIKNIPDEYRLSPKQQVQYEAVVNEEPQVDGVEIREFLDTLTYPLHSLDFETFRSAIPLIDGTRPYQQVPFQFSLHTISSLDDEPEHHEFIYAGEGDPRPALLEELRKIGDEGDVLVYNAYFERKILEELAEAFPEEEEWLKNVKKRLVDVAIPFKNFWYYDPEQHGSYSLKAVLPALVGTTYDGLDVSDGEQAMREYKRVAFGDVGEEEKDRTLNNLLEYCEQDTLALIEILRSLDRVAGKL